MDTFVDYVIIVSGIILCLKRVAEMERYHTLRVVVLCTVLSIVGGFLFLSFAAWFDNPLPQPACTDDGHFCLTEM